MSSRPRRPVNPVAIALCLMVLAVGVACIAAANANAAFYDVVFCAGGNGSGSPVLGARPNGFDFGIDCGEPPSYPADGDHYLRIYENTAGSAGPGDEASMSWYAPPYTSIVAGGGYTREPNAFNQGWRARFWGEDWGGGVHNIMLQGSGNIEGTGEFPWITKNATSIFASHLWPYGGWDDYKRFVFGLACVRPGGCDRANFNAADANTITLVANDAQDPQVTFEDGGTVRGEWVRGYQVLAWREFDQGSGLRFSRLGTDGSVFADGTIDYQANGGCHIGYRDGGREFGRSLQPCGSGPYLRYYGFETKSLPDGQHTLAICLQDYAQYINHAETCDRRTIHTDNTAPGKPASLEVTSANSARYLQHFGAKWSLPPDPGSPIAKVHYDVLDAAGKVVVPEKVLSATNPTSLPSIEGPRAPGAYSLRVWLEDSVGLIGPAAEVPIPHDTVPPAAPQGLSVTPPDTPRGADGFDLHWRDLTDSGSPIDAAHYQVLGAGGGVLVPTQTVSGENVDRAADIETARGSGEYTLRLWLTDAEGNVGAPVTAPLSYECVRSDVGGGTALSVGLGESGAAEEIVQQGSGSTLRGKISGPGGGLANAALCVFSRVTTHSSREFLGVALSGSDGTYQFAVPAGPSRELTALYRSGAREVAAHATIQTVVHPTFTAYRKVVYNKRYAQFTGSIPGPDNDQVVVVLQVKRGNGWLAFHRYRTREDGRFTLVYRFSRTDVPTKYLMRAQVRGGGAYAYLPGNSSLLTLIVLPRAPHHRQR
jgi:hypothetical protein